MKSIQKFDRENLREMRKIIETSLAKLSQETGLVFSKVVKTYEL